MDLGRWTDHEGVPDWRVMTAEDVEILKAAEGRILALELVSGEQFFAEIVMVVDEPPTPDVFLLRVLREPDGAFVAAAEGAGRVDSAGGDCAGGADSRGGLLTGGT